MRSISTEEIRGRLAFDNPWWQTGAIEARIDDLPRRSFFPEFLRLLGYDDVRRAILVLGPRRVGKTVMVTQAIGDLLEKGTSPTAILYVSFETPVYTGLSLEQIAREFCGIFGHDRSTRLTFVFDEIQYLKEWEVHLKSMVDSFPDWRFVVTGSAAAAIRMQSRESGAGRFTSFLLPHLLFEEYLRFAGVSGLVDLDDEGAPRTRDIDALNGAYVDYINSGGYPEAIINPTIREQSRRFIKSDVIDKVLLRDLPSLYGISDIQELNRFFTVIAYNSGDEIGYEALSQSSGVAKGTLKKYLEYLESAFLIHTLTPTRDDATRFQRLRNFKVYLSNPSIRAALFTRLEEDDPAMGEMNETAIVSQWLHSDRTERMHYVKLNPGEIDLAVVHAGTRRIERCIEIKWSDRIFRNPMEPKRGLERALDFAVRQGLDSLTVTTRTGYERRNLKGIPVDFIPSALFCYVTGLHVVQGIE